MELEQRVALRTGQTLELRRAMAEDASGVLEYLQIVAGESDNLGFGTGELQLTVEKEAEIIEQMNGGNGLFLVGIVAGELASVLSFEPGSRKRSSHVGEFGITVRQKYWNSGIGTVMLRNLIAWAEGTRRIYKINLRVRTDNAMAIAVYEKLGFQREGVLTRNMRIDGQFYDAYLMGLQLNPTEE